MSKLNDSTFASLVEWMEGNVPGAAPFPTEATEDEEALRWLLRFRRASEMLCIAAPPADLRRTLEERFEAFAADRRPAPFFQRLRAALTFDSGAQRSVAGARSAASLGLQRQFIFTADAAEVALNIQPHSQAQAVTLMGQVFAGDAETDSFFSVQLLQDSKEVAITTTDELGEFTFESVPAGQYELIVSSESFEITLAPVPLVGP